MKQITRRLERREHYAADHALVLRQTDAEKETTLQVRRVIPTGRTEELQIEIAIIKRGKKRNTHTYCSFIVPLISPISSPTLARLCALHATRPNPSDNACPSIRSR